MIDVLVVGPDVGTLDRITSLLEAQGWTVKKRQITAGQWVTALVSRVEEDQPKLVIVDVDYRFEATFGFLRQISGGEVRPTFLLLVTPDQDHVVVRANAIRGNVPMDFLLKPFDDNSFVSRVKSLLSRAVIY